MEMHSRHSLYEIHGISIERRRPRSRLAARLIARTVAFMQKVKRTIEAELKIRRAMAELAKMDDHMLRDLGIHRGEIEDRLRAQRADAGTNNASVFSNTTANSHPDLPTVNSPLMCLKDGPHRIAQTALVRAAVVRSKQVGCGKHRAPPTSMAWQSSRSEKARGRVQ